MPQKLLRITKKIILLAAALFLFLLSLRLIQASLTAGFHTDIEFWLKNNLSSPLHTLLASIAASIITLSGSPIAALGVSLHATNLIDTITFFTTILGSRLAPLLIFLIPFSRRNLRFVIVAWLSTVSIFIFATPLFPFFYHSAFTTTISRFFSRILPRHSIIDTFLTNFSNFFTSLADPAIILALAIALFIFSLHFFNKTLTSTDLTFEKTKNLNFLQKTIAKIKNIPTFFFRHESKLAKSLQNNSIAFLLGGGITLITMSLTASLGILVPFYLRRIIRDHAVIFYVLGANITTLFDTLILAVATQHISTIHIMTTIILSVSLAVLLLATIARTTLFAFTKIFSR